jgi:glycosyltransferase 2 family protein
MLTRLRATIGRRQKFFLKLAFGLSLITVVLYFVDFGEVADVLRRINPRFVILGIALIYTDRALMAYKWNPLLHIVGIRVPLGLLFRLYVVAPFAGMLLPANVGSDLFRAYGVSRYGFDVKAVLASIFVERALGFISMMVLVFMSIGLASYLLGEKLAQFSALWWILGTGALLVTGMVAFYYLVRGQRDGWTLRISNLPIVRQFHQVYLITQQYRGHLDTLGVVCTWTCLEQLVPIAMTFLVARSLNVDISVLELAAIVPIIVLAIRLPISLGGIGIQEGLSVALYSLVGVSPAEALLMNALGRVLHLLTQLPWAAHYIFARKRCAPQKFHPRGSGHDITQPR